MPDISENISNIKQKLPNITPVPPDFHQQATTHELKSRLNWGEPALTILDVRDPETFRKCHIMGAMQFPMDELESRAKSSLEFNREIYIYGGSDEETANAANILRQAGFQKVAELQGGVDTWLEIGGSVEGSETDFPPSAGDFNVVSRLQEHSEQKAKEDRMKQGNR